MGKLGGCYILSETGTPATRAALSERHIANYRAFRSIRAEIRRGRQVLPSISGFAGEGGNINEAKHTLAGY